VRLETTSFALKSLSRHLRLASSPSVRITDKHIVTFIAVVIVVAALQVVFGHSRCDALRCCMDPFVVD
jgi:hypothetical protein